MLAAAILLSSMMCAADPAAEFQVEEYFFRWTVIETADNSLKVIKTGRNATIVQLGDDSDDRTIILRPADAAAIGKVLKQTETVSEKLAANKSPKCSEEVRAGRWLVFFSRDGDKFDVGITDAKDESSPMALISREEAAELAPHLMKAVEMAKYVDEKVKP